MPSFLLVLTDIGAGYIFQVELYKVSNIHEMCWDCRAVRFLYNLPCGTCGTRSGKILLPDD